MPQTTTRVSRRRVGAAAFVILATFFTALAPIQVPTAEAQGNCVLPGSLNAGTSYSLTRNRNVRTGPSFGCGVIKLASKGSTVVVHGQRRTKSGFIWAPVTSGGVTGWLAIRRSDGTGSVLASAACTLPGSLNAGTNYTLSQNRNIRTGPGFGCGVVKLATKGSGLVVHGQRRTKSGFIWAPVTSGGVRGWLAIKRADGTGSVLLPGNNSCSPVGPPSNLIYNEIVLPRRDNVVIRTRPLVASCADSGERVDFDERVRVRGERGDWFYVESIDNVNGQFLRSAPGWVRKSDVGTNEAVRVYWNDSGIEAWNVDLKIRVGNTTNDVFFNQQFRWNAGGAGYFGFQQFPEGRKFIFSLFPSSASGPGQVLDFNSNFDCQIAPDEPGVSRPLRCLDDFNWQVGRDYTLRLWRLGPETGGVRWGAWIQDAAGNDLFKVGDFLVRAPAGPAHGISDVTTFIEDFNNGRDCSVPGSTRFHVARPSYNNGTAAATYGGSSIGPCGAGSTVPSKNYAGGRELRFNVG